MSDQLALSPAIVRPKNRQHAAFCRAVAGGMTQTGAYERYIMRPGSRRDTAWQLSGDMARRYRAHITDLRERLAAEADKAGIMSKVEIMQFLSRAVRTPIAHIDAHSELAQEHSVTTDQAGNETVKIKSVPKLEAVHQLSKLQGFEAPTQHQHIHAIVETPALSMLQGWSGRTTTMAQQLTHVSSVEVSTDCATSTPPEDRRTTEPANEQMADRLTDGEPGEYRADSLGDQPEPQSSQSTGQDQVEVNVSGESSPVVEQRTAKQPTETGVDGMTEHRDEQSEGVDVESIQTEKNPLIQSSIKPLAMPEDTQDE